LAYTPNLNGGLKIMLAKLWYWSYIYLLL